MVAVDINHLLSQFKGALVFIRLATIGNESELVEFQEIIHKWNDFVFDRATVRWCLRDLIQEELSIKDQKIEEVFSRSS